MHLKIPTGILLGMEKLRLFINSLDCDAQSAFALSCGTSIGYIRKAISVGAKLNPVLSVAIERESSGNVTRKDLHDNWMDIWPELVPDRAA